MSRIRSSASNGDTSSSNCTLALPRRVTSLLLCYIIALALVAFFPLRRAFEVELEVETSGGEVGDAATGVPLVAIVACVKQKDWQRPADFIERTLLPSIHVTVTDGERRRYRVELILGYDHDDEYWASTRNHNLLPKSGGDGERLRAERWPLPVSYVAIRKDPRGERPNRIPFNELCRAAYDYGAEFIVRINDDSEFVTTGWITAATEALSTFSPPNLGVVGPSCGDDASDRIMTHDMVHAPTHYSVFDTYYAARFDNYYVDDWMTHVYGEDRTKKLADWEVRHHLHQFATRYRPTFDQIESLNQTVAEDHQRVEQFLSTLNSGAKKAQREDTGRGRVLGTDTIDRVDGPMKRAHLSLMKKGNFQR